MKKADSHAKKTEPMAAAAGATDAAIGVADPATAAAASGGITPEQLVDLKAQAAKASEHWDRLLRTAADFENFKKRAARERHEAAQSATAGLIHKLLPVLDHFEMAQAAAKTAQGDKLAALQDGIAMIQQQLKSVLTESGLEEVDARGQPFDPMFHEAVSQLESAETPEGHVLQQIRKGYRMQNRLLRPATVVVAKKPSSPAPANPPAA